MTRIACLLAFATVLACGNDDDGGSESGVERGRYLVDHVSLCIDCHTPRKPDGSFDNMRYLGGTECFVNVDPAEGTGCLHTKNLTNDATGLANLTDTQIVDLFQHGVTPTGKALIPVMPYWLFHNMTDEDAHAIVAYLRTVPAVSHAVPASEPPWEAPAAPAEPIDPKTIPPAPEGDESAARGRYLAGMAGVCIECHTPQLGPEAPRPIDMTRPFAGGRDFQPGLPSPPYPPHIYSRNLTQDATGLAGWTADDVVKVLKQGQSRDGSAICLPMPSGPMGQFGALTDDDARDIANYILTLPGVSNQVPSECVAP